MGEIPPEVNNSALIVESMNSTEPKDCWRDYNYNQELMWVKVPLVLGFGSTLSCISILENIYLSYLFATYPIFRTSHMFYMAVLAVIDVFVNINYLLLMALPILYEKTLSLTLYHAWITYVLPMLAASLACITVGTYLVVAATLERYLKAVNSRWSIIRCVERHRASIVVAIFVFALLLRGSRFFELKIDVDPDCVGTFQEYGIALSDWVIKNVAYREYFGFYIRNIFHVLFPFIGLLYMNIAILIAVQAGLKRDLHAPSSAISIHSPEGELLNGNASSISANNSASAQQIKDCTRMLMSVVAMYLVSNSLFVLVTVWEMVDLESLLYFENFYNLFNDIVSLMTVICTTLRLPVYYACNRAIRVETKRFVYRLFGRSSKSTNESGCTQISSDHGVNLTHGYSNNIIESTPYSTITNLNNHSKHNENSGLCSTDFPRFSNGNLVKPLLCDCEKTSKSVIIRQKISPMRIMENGRIIDEIDQFIEPPSQFTQSKQQFFYYNAGTGTRV